ncbi:hypothetical protein M434DRAFT_36143 [Hypoxylon sp. CO27-5]|nr:hypothetical protein M434DRAFT_36143 [Hypoxylon sp. CO27-5]
MSGRNNNIIYTDKYTYYDKLQTLASPNLTNLPDFVEKMTERTSQIYSRLSDLKLLIKEATDKENKMQDSLKTAVDKAKVKADLTETREKKRELVKERDGLVKELQNLL